MTSSISFPFSSSRVILEAILYPPQRTVVVGKLKKETEIDPQH